MKLQLIRTEEADGKWFKIVSENEIFECYKITDKNEDEKLAQAEEKFREIAARFTKPFKTEVIKFETIETVTI